MRFFWNLSLNRKGITFNPATRIGRRLGVTVSKRGFWPSWRIK
jgi:hypothetical protein